MKDWDEKLRQLADNPAEDYERDGGMVMLVRQGVQHVLNVKTVPAIGDAVETPPTGPDGKGKLVPIDHYIQKELLGLPRFAGQLIRALDKGVKDRPVPFVEGPAECLVGKATNKWPDAVAALRNHLIEKVPGTTRFVQLYGSRWAGQDRSPRADRPPKRSRLHAT